MPYRRLPKTDSARLRSLKAVLDCNDLYTVGNRFISWEVMNQARQAYDRLLTAVEQYRANHTAQTRGGSRIVPLQNKAMLYVSHFLQVLLMAVERGEIKRNLLTLYGLPEDTTNLPNIKTIGGLIDYGNKAVEGEKARLKKGGRPIYNPSAGMVSTHLDIFREAYERQKVMQERTAKATERLRELRPEVDDVVLTLWNMIEKNYSSLPAEERLEACRRLGVTYYYRPDEKKRQ